MDSCLINTTEYNGKYVALNSESDNTVVGSGTTPREALDMAAANGNSNAVLLYVEEPGSIQIY
jgi:hypothetical protein